MGSVVFLYLVTDELMPWMFSCLPPFIKEILFVSKYSTVFDLQSRQHFVRLRLNNFDNNSDGMNRFLLPPLLLQLVHKNQNIHQGPIVELEYELPTSKYREFTSLVH